MTTKTKKSSLKFEFLFSVVSKKRRGAWGCKITMNFQSVTERDIINEGTN